MNNTNPYISDLFINGQHYGVIDNPNEYGRTIILHKVEGIDLSKISEEEFISLMNKALSTACEKYTSLVTDEVNERMEKSYSSYAATAMRALKAKYARQSTIDKHLAQKMEGLHERLEKFYSYDRCISFTCWPGPHLSVPGVTMGLSTKTTDYALKNAFTALSENEWFKKGTGFLFRYSCNKISHVSSCGGEIEILMNEKDKAAEKAGQKAIDSEITAYYANKRPGEYCGD